MSAPEFQNEQLTLLRRNLQALRLALSAGLLMIAAVITYGIYDGRRTIEADERGLLSNQAGVIEKNLAQRLGAANAALDSIRHEMRWLLAQKNGELMANRRLQALCDAMVGVRTFVFIDGKGNAVASNRSELVGRNFVDGERFQAIRTGGDPAMLYVSAPFKTPLGVYAMSVGKMMQDGSGAFDGVVLAILDPDFFRTLLDSVRYTPDTWAMVIHGDGKVVLGLPDSRVAAGSDLGAKPDSFFNRHMKGGRASDVFSGRSAFSGDERLMAFRTSRPETTATDKPLVIVVSRAAEAVYAQWREQSLIKIGLFGLLCLVSAIGMILYRRRQLAYVRLIADREVERKAMDAALRASEAQYVAELKSVHDRLASFALEQNRAIEAERKRVAREVHDQIGQVFTAIKLIVASLPHEQFPPGQAAALAQALEMGIATTRRITAELRPPLLDDLGLAAALEHLGKQTAAAGQLDCSADIEAEAVLDATQALALFRIAQEAITNVLRHAGATRVLMTGRRQDDRYVFSVEDDGRGFQVAEVRQGAMGLVSMRERAALLGGTCKVDARPGDGTHVTVLLPLRENAAYEHPAA